MPPRLQLKGKRFSRLLVQEFAFIRKGASYWKCVCDCGNTTIVQGTNLKSGTTKSCGCLMRERTSKANSTHGMSDSPEYGVWCNMKNRCYNPISSSYHLYGKRGIEVCEGWKDSFENFIEDVGLRPSSNHSLDRINSNGNYEPENVRWVPQEEQNWNLRTNRMITHDGKTQCLAQWAQETGIDASTIRARLDRYGWSVERALTEAPIVGKNQFTQFNDPS